jgi:hypothetical protein
MNMAHLVMERLGRTAQMNGQKTLGDSLMARSAELDTLYQEKLQDIATQGLRTSRARF